MELRTDETLIGAYLEGDEEALRTLIGRYVGPVFRFIHRYLGDEDDAKDITQDVFVNAWKHLKRFDRTKKFKTWIFTIAKNASLNLLKKKRPSLFSELEDEEGNLGLEETLADPAPLPEELFARADLVLQLSLALQKLHPEHRTVLLMHYQDQLTFQEIGEFLGEPLHTVKSRHRRALLALRKLLIS